MLKAAKWTWLLALLAGMSAGQQSPAPLGPLDTAQEQLPSEPSPQNNVPAPAPVPTPPSVPAPAPEPPERAFTPAAPGPPNERDEIINTMRVDVRFVVVPVMVKDLSGHLVEGLSRKDFAVFEDGVQQQIRFFTSDP
ncbi:MAG: hypothetical protein WA463_11070, partial [Terriglobales bacterium]